MRIPRTLLALTLLTSVAVSQGPLTPKIGIAEVPPEPFPQGTCTGSHSGYVGVEVNGETRWKLTEEEIGKYVSQRIKDGYSVTLYPQTSGRIFTIEKCENPKR